jgi:hypothetical protein
MTLYLEKDERNNIRVITDIGSRVVEEKNVWSYYMVRSEFKVRHISMALDNPSNSLEYAVLNASPVYGEGVCDEE